MDWASGNHDVGKKDISGINGNIHFLKNSQSRKITRISKLPPVLIRKQKRLKYGYMIADIFMDGGSYKR